MFSIILFHINATLEGYNLIIYICKWIKYKNENYIFIFLIHKAHKSVNSLSLPHAMDEEVSSQKLPQHHAYLPATVPAALIMNSLKLQTQGNSSVSCLYHGFLLQ